MKKNYFKLLLLACCLLILASCSTKFRFVTKGLREQDSSYYITNNGKRVNATNIEVRPRKVTVDKQIISLDSITAIKSKKMYFSVSDGTLYLCQIYGKMNLLYKLIHTTEFVYGTNTVGGFGATGAYGSMGGSYQPRVSKVYYIQKAGSTDIDRLNHANFISYVSDNDEALKKARGAYGWLYGNYVAEAGFTGGIIYTFVALFRTKQNNDGTVTSPSFAPGLIAIGLSIPPMIVCSSIYHHKLMKAIKIYNQPSAN